MKSAFAKLIEPLSFDTQAVGAAYDEAAANARTLDAELAWFARLLEARMQRYFEADEAGAPLDDIAPPAIAADDQSAYADAVRRYGFGRDERAVLILALLPHLRPQALDLLLIRNKETARAFTEFGGYAGKHHAGLLPTCETAIFVLAGGDLRRRLDVLRLFVGDHPLLAQGLLKIDPPAAGEPPLSGALRIGPEYLHRFTTGKRRKPDYSSEFPAKLIHTRLGWNDLVLGPDVLDEIENIVVWLQRSETLLEDWGLADAVKPGYRALFYGPPGTGKTLTATLIGAATNTDVYRIDLSMVVSKYIGETEKNLANVFDQAEHQNWILFFDEADALFGQRTQTTNSNDRYANQEVAYLLQRVEDFPGVAILATNLKANIDDAFARRFQSAVYFPMPDAAQRLRLWRGLFRDPERCAADVDFVKLADTYPLSGGALTNIARYAAMRASRKQRDRIVQEDLVIGIGKELQKEGRTL